MDESDESDANSTPGQTPPVKSRTVGTTSASAAAAGTSGSGAAASGESGLVNLPSPTSKLLAGALGNVGEPDPTSAGATGVAGAAPSNRSPRPADRFLFKPAIKTTDDAGATTQGMICFAARPLPSI